MQAEGAAWCGMEHPSPPPLSLQLSHSASSSCLCARAELQGPQLGGERRAGQWGHLCLLAGAQPASLTSFYEAGSLALLLKGCSLPSGIPGWLQPQGNGTLHFFGALVPVRWVGWCVGTLDKSEVEWG